MAAEEEEEEEENEDLIYHVDGQNVREHHNQFFSQSRKDVEGDHLHR